MATALYDDLSYRHADVLPTQYNDLVRRSSVLTAERKLMWAVLADAVESYLKHMNAKTPNRRRLFYEVQSWMSAKGRVGLFSYETLCESLGIDAKRLRAELEKRA
jgi:putative NADPH-quinone reductase